NINASGGTIKSGYSQFTIRTEGEFKNVDDVRNIIVTYQRGIPVYLRYVADVNWGISEEVSTSRFNNKPGLRLVVYKQSGANTVQAVDSLRAKLERIRAELPAGVQLLEAFSSADFTRNSIGNTASSAILGGILAVIIVLIFLRNIRASMIIGLAIPTSIIATFIGMYFFKVNLNMISLGGLTLGIGMLVDNAIIVLENTFNYMSRGAKPAKAARLGAQEIAGAIFASTLTTVCVFLPIVFTDGMAKEIFKDMALTVSFSLMASIFVAVTLVPMLSAKYLRYHDEKELKKLEPRLYKIVSFGERILEFLESKYKEGIRWALANRKMLIIAVVGIFLFTMMVVMRGVDSEFFPESDQASIKVTVTMPVGTRLETTNEAVEQMIGLLKKAVPEKYIRNVFFVSGSPGGFSAIFNASGSHVSTLRARLVSKSERDKTTTEYIKTLKDLVQKAPAPLGVAAVNISGQVGPGFGGGAPIDILVRGYDLKKGAEISKQLKTIMEKVPGLYNIDVSRKEG
ncbi:MAG TPA: efflux RND transporter permease subunit, partial [Spirochaetota bacterium]|nr:efflux RND transporter permease subunit [Spirochaetota bacterium]